MNIDLIELKQHLPHFPVLIREVLKLLCSNSLPQTVVDCTFGAGGYSEAILKYTNSIVIAIDRDISTSEFANILKKKYPNRFFFYNNTFSNIDTVLTQNNKNQVDLIIADLGVSTMQLLNGDRGFSLKNNGPLAMTMGINKFSAFDFINKAKESEISQVLWEYGEERKSRKIAKYIINKRAQGPINTTKELRNIIHNALNYKVNKNGKDVATKSFQAIRIHVNNELLELITMLNKTPYLITNNGKIAIITFHSLEDRIVKIFFNDLESINNDNDVMEQKFTIFKPKNNKLIPAFNLVTKKPVIPSLDEIEINKNSSTAKLRVIQRIG